MLLNDTIIDHKGISAMSIDDDSQMGPQLPPIHFTNEDFSMNTNPKSSSSGHQLSGM